MKTPQTISDFIVLLTAVKEKYGDLKVRTTTSDYMNDNDYYSEFDDVVISPRIESLLHDNKYDNESYLLFISN